MHLSCARCVQIPRRRIRFLPSAVGDDRRSSFFLCFLWPATLLNGRPCFTSVASSFAFCQVLRRPSGRFKLLPHRSQMALLATCHNSLRVGLNNGVIKPELRRRSQHLVSWRELAAVPRRLWLDTLDVRIQVGVLDRYLVSRRPPLARLFPPGLTTLNLGLPTLRGDEGAQLWSLAALPLLPCLTSFTLNFLGERVPYELDLAFLPRCLELRELSCFSSDLDSAAIACIGACQSLRTLGLCSFTENVMQRLCAAPPPKLERLQLWYREIRAIMLPAAHAGLLVAHLPSLTELSGYTFASHTVSSLRHLRQLQVLRWVSSLAPLIEVLPVCGALRSLTLGSTVSDGDLVRLLCATAGRLESLEFRDCRLSPVFRLEGFDDEDPRFPRQLALSGHTLVGDYVLRQQPDLHSVRELRLLFHEGYLAELQHHYEQTQARDAEMKSYFDRREAARLQAPGPSLYTEPVSSAWP